MSLVRSPTPEAAGQIAGPEVGVVGEAAEVEEAVPTLCLPMHQPQHQDLLP